MSGQGRPLETLDPLPPGLLRQPIAYIEADHHRHRVLCRLAEQLAGALAEGGPPMPDVARSIADFLAQDMALHLVDEEQDLFPLLRRRAEPGDEIEAILGRLSTEHAAEELQSRGLVEALRRLAGDDGPADPAIAAGLVAYARAERAHLALENAVVMPLARARLKPSDLRALALRMAARRGIDLAGDEPPGGAAG